MNIKEFWKEYDVSDKEHKKWEKRADKVIKRYRLESESGDGEVSPSFNILWANNAVMEPELFSKVPTPDISRRYKNDDPVAKQGALVLERGLEFLLDDGNFFEFGEESVKDYQLPGRTVCKVRYVPTYATSTQQVMVEARETLGPEGKEYAYYDEGKQVDTESVRFDQGKAYADREYEEVVDEHVVIERWPWKNFRHQKAKRWRDVCWCDYISYLDRDQLKKLFGKRKAAEIELTVDASGNEDGKDSGFNATHAEVHEVWFKRERKVKLAVTGVQDKWLKEVADPLNLDGFWPTPEPLLAVDTNDSLQPIPLFTLYQHQANELDQITKRIAVLMRALKLAGFYAGSEKELMQKLFEADENQMIPVEDWHTLKESGGVSGLIEWLPIEQVGKVLTALFREREQIVSQIFELTGIADIQRGSSDPRETKGSQVIKAQFAHRRMLIPKRQIENYFRDTLRIAAEIMAEIFSADTLQRMTGLQVPEEVHQLLKDQLSRQYRIDIETDSTVAPDEETEQANMAKALEAVTRYVASIGPLVQAGTIDQRAAIQLLKVYLRKFKWGREMESTLDEIEKTPAQPKPDPKAEALKMQAQLDQQKMQAEMQMKQQQSEMDMRQQQAELQMKVQELQMKLVAMQQEMKLKAMQGQQELQQSAVDHQQGMMMDAQSHQMKLQQQETLANAKALQVRRSNEKRPTDR